MLITNPTPPEHPPLRGEAPPGLYGFTDETGARVEGGEGIIPILEVIGENRYQFIGTGFFITSSGVFATARHVLIPAHERGHAILTWQVVSPNQWLTRPVTQFSYHETADLAIGVATPGRHSESRDLLSHPRVRITTRVHSIGDIVATYAYPNTIIEQRDEGQILSFEPRFYEGRIMEYLPEGRDRVMLPGPCYRSDMVIQHGASGGPVAGPSGRVFGVNATGFDGTDDFYISRIDEFLSLEIDLGEGERITIQELADQGVVTMDP